MLIIGLILLLLFWLVPIKIGAMVVHAGRDSLGACMLAVVVSWFFLLILAMVLHHGLLLSVLPSTFAYMLVLRTTFLRALAIAAIQVVITAIFVVTFGAMLFAPVVSQVFRV